MSKHHYCSYFDHRYLARGLAMIRSLREFDPQATFWVLCLSETCEAALEALAEPNVRTISLAAFEAGDADLLAAKANRNLMEYYFTCSPSLVRYVLRQADAGDIVTYVDGDLYFFDNPAPLYEALGDGAVSIIPHRFPQKLKDREVYGLYNVGWLSFVNDPRGIAAADWWRTRCNAWCYDRLEGDAFADQKYLDRFEELFEGVVVIDHPGANLAPWNVGGHQLAWSQGRIEVDGRPLLFFHFHGLRSLGRSWYFAVHALYRAPLGPLIRNRIYRPYLERLNAIREEVSHLVDVPPSVSLARGSDTAGLWERFKAKVRQPKRIVTLFLLGQAFHVSGSGARR